MESKYLFFIVATISICFVIGDEINETRASNSSDLPEQNANTTTVKGTESETISSTPSSASQNIQKLTRKRCARDYNMNCLKIDLISSIEKLGRNTDFQLLPGMKIVSDADVFSSQKNYDTKMVFSADNVNQQLNELLARRLLGYAKSLSLRVQLFDKNEKKGKSLENAVFDNLIRQSNNQGRANEKKNKWGSTLITAGLLTGGTLLWMGLSSLMAMATKALAASLLSIVISLVTAYRSSGSPHHSKSTTYEIVAKPVYPHAYTGELQHEPYAAASGHQYGRNIEWDKLTGVFSPSELPVPSRDDSHQYAYRAHMRDRMSGI